MTQAKNILVVDANARITVTELRNYGITVTVH